MAKSSLAMSATVEFGRELAARGIDGVKLDRLAGRDPCDGRIGVVPAEMALVLVDGVMVLVHGP